ncbi:uncharacterized protein TRIADDRAFT_38469 [Trichoplax adhaerens]|uniref:phosphatidylinositol-3,5-bisphosphate 3-phosphatase n=1 Tax=Trichoplax adhaerens TaxID=10228 RepID=B3SBP9_TRIAD|nr:hypothetical protein TRIADDRAFT_38469 [Trichoplax adhaerens]EDV19826.1 hypothetical protein TRIADDRAFT_38469 [Trichoplax adhaerens]|eukprot:XP_002117696.1 hypothetical protein TRIADDRAFT_38469 [Trichoplax adhaerens]
MLSFSIVSDVTYLCPYAGRLKGDVIVTNYKLFFKCTSADEGVTQHNFLVPLGCIAEVKKVSYTKNRENSYNLDIVCKDLRVLRFSHKAEATSRRLVYSALMINAFPVTRKDEFFAYKFKGNYPDFESTGWKIFDPQVEYKRMVRTRRGLWKTTDINNDYKFCSSYPSLLVVPDAANEENLKSVAEHRTRNRLPVLTWVHPEHPPVILRCSQPTSGLIDKPSEEDKNYFRLIWEANSDQKIYVVDARPKKNAVANKLKGGGFEANEKYTNMELEFLDIENIHVMRDSMNKLRDVCYAIDDVHWYANLESTKWLEHIKLVLAGAIFIVDLVERRYHSVIVHCSDGWDRTAQLTGLSMLLLDPEYRTINGFQVLIEKEWLSFGHKFAQRIGHGENKPNDSERSPVFLQFMDCVWQVLQQFPCAFEFNERLLIAILDHLYSCLFGTFLYDCERVREEHNLKTKTFSLWDYINLNVEDYKNVQYTRHEHVIYPNASLRYISLWSSYYLRWNPRTRRQV